MGRSVEELKAESEHSRAELTATVAQLKERLSDTVEDIRQNVSPHHIKSEVSEYISQKTQGWLSSVKQQARDHPMQAIATGAVVAVPLLRLTRGLPLPLLMIGAGVAISSKALRERAAESTAPVTEKAGKLLNEAGERAQMLVGNVRNKASSANDQANDLATDTQERAGDLAENLKSHAAQTTSTVTDAFSDGVSAAANTLQQARSAAKERLDAAKGAATAAPENARRLIGDNAAIIGSLGVAIGAILAAALPKTEAETKIMGGVSDSAVEAARTATESGLQAARDRTMSAVEAAAKSIEEADLGTHASRITENLASALKDAAKDAVTAAVSPSQDATPERSS